MHTEVCFLCWQLHHELGSHCEVCEHSVESVEHHHASCVPYHKMT
jgi:hypothetical protein